MFWRSLATLAALLCWDAARAASPTAEDCARIGARISGRQPAVLLSKIPEIQSFNLQAKVLPEEMPRGGRWLSSTASSDLAALPAGKYIYMLFADGTGLYSPRVPDPHGSEAQFLMTHWGLYNEARATLGREPAIVATGEFFVQQQNGASITTLINNKSGKSKGRAENLSYAENYFRRHHLPFVDGPGARTQRIDLHSTKVPEVHLAESAAARLERRYAQDPQLKAIAQHLQYTLAELRRRFPHPTQAGRIDTARLFDADVLKEWGNSSFDQFVTGAEFIRLAEMDDFETGLNSLEQGSRRWMQISPEEQTNALAIANKDYPRDAAKAWDLSNDIAYERNWQQNGMGIAKTLSDFLMRLADRAQDAQTKSR